MAVAVNESGKNRLAPEVDDPAALRNIHIAAFADGFDSLAFDDDHNILQRRTARGVD